MLEPHVHAHIYIYIYYLTQITLHSLQNTLRYFTNRSTKKNISFIVNEEDCE